MAMKYFIIMMLLLSVGSVVHADICDILWLSQARPRQVEQQIKQQGADVNQVCNEFEDRPLHLALIYELDSRIVYTLLNNCANISAPNRSGETPVTIIEERYYFAIQSVAETSKLLDSQEITQQEHNQMRQTLSKINSIHNAIDRIILGHRQINCPEPDK